MHSLTRSRQKTLKPLFLLLALLGFGCYPLLSLSQNVSDALARALDAYVNRTPLAEPLKSLSRSSAIEIQDLIVMNLAPDYGLVSGYLREPLRQEAALGVLLENMFTSTGATLQAAAKADQRVFLSWAVRIRKAGLSESSGPAEITGAIAELIPAVVLQDVLINASDQDNWSAITALNAGVRYVVLGAPVAFSAHSAIPGLRAELLGRSGQQLAVGDGVSSETTDVALLIHNMVVALSTRGRSVREGELLVLGPVGQAVALTQPGRVTANFRIGAEERRIVFPIRP